MNLASILVSLLLLVPQAATEKTSKGDLKITPITHGTLMFEYGGKAVLVSSPPTDLAKKTQADGGFISGIYGDHFHPPTNDTVKKEGAQIRAPTPVAAMNARAGGRKDG